MPRGPWRDLRSSLWAFDALSWQTVYHKVWAGRRYALIVIKRVPAGTVPDGQRGAGQTRQQRERKQ